MKPDEMAAAVESLSKLEEHYQAQYEEYMNLAMSAKEQLERLRFLLRDLAPKPVLKSEAQFSLFDLEEDSNPTSGQFKQSELFTASLEDQQKQLAESEDVNDEELEADQEISHRRFRELLTQVMPVIESIFHEEHGKTLHINYLHKIVNQKANLSLSLDTVGLYLDEAIALGYCERDNYDSNCYLSISDKKTLIEEAFRNNPYKSIRAEVKEKQKESVQLTKKVHNLPPSPKSKVDILTIIYSYIADCKPKTFTARDILNYLYTNEEQRSWTKEQERKNLQAITGRLADYVNKKDWKRVKRGVYKPTG